MSAGTAATALTGVAGTAAAVGDPTPRLSTDGRWIVDPDGEHFVMRGFATAGLDHVAESWYPFTIPEVVERATDGEDWHPNAIRLPVTEWPFLEQGADYVIDELLRPAVDLLADRGVYAVIDFHLIRPYVDAMGNAEGMVSDGWVETIDDLGFDADVPTDQLLTDFWSAVAPAFADDEHVLYELFNEPTLPVSWSSYGEYGDQVGSREESWELWKQAAQPWVETIRDHAPETPVVIGSPSWTSETQFAPASPFDGENLIYAGHIYPANGRPYEEYVHDGETQDPFDPEYGAPAEDVPVVVTEFGWSPDEPTDSEGYGLTSDWGEPFREWVESYDNVGWLAWCFDDTWAPTFFDSPGDGAGEPWTLKDGAEQSGGYVQQWLQETEGDGEPTDPCVERGAEGGSAAVDGQTVCDVNDDGYYRDVTGDGSVGQGDVAEFFTKQHRSAWKQPDLFDYSENGAVTHGDVVDLFDYVALQ